MQLLDLPDELLVLCCNQLDMFATQAFRLTSKRMVPMATKRLFSRIHLLPTTESANKARAILENKDLMPLVTTVSIKTSLEETEHPTWDIESWADDDPEDPDYEEHDIETDGEVSREFKVLLNDIGLFRNLRRVELKFDWEVVGLGGWDSGNHKEWREYREPFLRSVFGALNHAEHPALRVHSLSICNLHDLSNYEILKSDDFKAVLSRIDTLELGIATEEQSASPESNIECSERHQFFGTDLVDYWLAPVQHNLVNLKIYSSCYWGYLPKCDLRKLHFPKVKGLALGNMTFTHDWQLDWIVSHGKTLESLTLDDCPIVHDAMVGQVIDHERYVKLQDDKSLQWEDSENIWSYSSRWHDYLRKMTTGLPRLQHFGMGHGAWNNCYDEDNVTQAFEAAASLPAQLETGRYIIFHWGTGPSAWIEPKGHGRGNYAEPTKKITELDNQYDCCWDADDDDPPLPSYPDCWDRDQEAFDVFMAAVEGRRASKHSI
jgi:hypothetical protein